MRDGVLAIALLAAGPTPVATSVAEAFELYAAPQTLVRLPDGRRMNIHCTGPATPGTTVLLEAGWSNSNLAWRYVQPLIAAKTRVCSYDRAGLGFSDPAAGARDTEHIVADLEALLRAAEVKPPYVIVGYSMGGLSARLFTDRQGDAVVGMVLVEPSSEHQATRFAEAFPGRTGASRPVSDDQADCAPEIPGSGDCQDRWRLPPPVAAKAAEIAGSPGYQRTIIAELLGMGDAGSAQVAASKRSYGAMPLIVLTGGENRGDASYTPAQALRFKAIWQAMHADVAALSKRGEHRVLPDATHLVVLEKPESVATAVQDVIAASATGALGK